MTKPTLLDLFCGAGGFSCGMEKAGFRVLAGVDNDEKPLVTYESNHQDAKGILYDLGNIESDLFDKIDGVTKGQSIDVLIGGPPCQGFSIAGKRLEDDPRNKLWNAYTTIVDKYQPKVIVLENVPTIINSSQGKVKDAIIRSFKQHGYETTVRVLMASDYGVPQNRKRAFFVAVKKGLKPFEFPSVLKEAKVTTEQALNDLPLLENDLGEEESEYLKEPSTPYQAEMRKDSDKLFNHSAVNHTEKTKSIINLVPDGGNYKDLPEHLKDTRRVNIAWTRMNSKKPCFTIDAGHNHHFHYKANRVPTVRECARIQSFPDDFVFLGTRTSQYRQVGNAVPPKLGFYIGSKVLEVLNND